MRKTIVSAVLTAVSVLLVCVAEAQQQSTVSSTSTASSSIAALPAASAPSAKSGAASNPRKSPIRGDASVRIEGEKRFHANCSRCHMAPQKLPPRAAATIIRHMRVRATITDEDMRYILAYLAQ
jgi:mono/diheme cytochrome c family protein